MPVERSMEALNMREKNSRTREEGAEPRQSRVLYSVSNH